MGLHPPAAIKIKNNSGVIFAGKHARVFGFLSLFFFIFFRRGGNRHKAKSVRSTAKTGLAQFGGNASFFTGFYDFGGEDNFKEIASEKREHSEDDRIFNPSDEERQV